MELTHSILYMRISYHLLLCQTCCPGARTSSQATNQRCATRQSSLCYGLQRIPVSNEKVSWGHLWGPLYCWYSLIPHICCGRQHSRGAWQEKQCWEVKGSLRALGSWAVSLGDGRIDKLWLAFKDGGHLLQSSDSHQPGFSAHPGMKQKEGKGCHFCHHHYHGTTTT